MLRNTGFFVVDPFRIRINNNIIRRGIFGGGSQHELSARVMLTTAYDKDDNMTDDDKKNGSGQSQLVLDSRTSTKKPSMYKVIMLNDDYTPMEFVILVLERFFSKSEEEATQIMLHVHQKGVGVCGVFTYEVAETKVQQVMDLAKQHQHPLQCTMEKEE